MLDALRAQGAPTENARIEVQEIADGYARVAVFYDVVARPDLWDLGFAYVEQGRGRSAPASPRNMWKQPGFRVASGPMVG